jgi:ADP-ribose pyrophosphatase YjhB (NUDIX family)
VGFPARTVDVPRRDPGLAAAIALTRHDPTGDAARLAALLGRDGPASGHLAASAWVLDPRAEQVLLVRHPLLGWACPGGHVEPGETMLEAARRELHEETGIEAVVAFPEPFTVGRLRFPAGPSGPAHIHWVVAVALVADPSAALNPEAAAPAAWFPVEALPTPRVPDLDNGLPALVPLVLASRADPN